MDVGLAIIYFPTAPAKGVFITRFRLRSEAHLRPVLSEVTLDYQQSNDFANGGGRFLVVKRLEEATQQYQPYLGKASVGT